MRSSKTRSVVSIASSALILTISVTAAAGGLGGYVAISQIISLQNQNSQLQSKTNELSATISSDENQISSLQSNITNLESENSNLQSQNSNLSNQITSDENQIISLQSQVSNLQNELGTGGTNHFSMWSGAKYAAQFTGSNYYSENVPDTFDYYDSWTSTVPVIVYYLTQQQFVQFVNCGDSISCVAGQYQYEPSATSANYEFTLAEGCGGYIAVYTASSAGTLTPNISVTYNPASSSTGVCA
ncbi:MAG: hypothetical protein ACREAN_05770 [Nitrosopumilaceae archaeon]